MTRKIQKITPEWQSEPFFCSVGSAVARVKGKHHYGDAAKLCGILCRQFRWYRELFRPVGMKGFFYLQKSEECKSKINFQISKLIRKFIDVYKRQVPIFVDGKLVYECPKAMDIQAYCNREKDTLWEEQKRLRSV